MLKSIEAAFQAAGRSKAAIARDLGMTSQTLHLYFVGKLMVPKHRRARLDRAIGVAVDWAAYDQEYAHALDVRVPAPKAPEAPKAAPSGSWGQPVAPAKPKAASTPAPAPKAAPAPAPAKRTWLGGLIKDDGEDAFA